MASRVAVGLWLARHDGRELGLPYPPFVGRWDPAATGVGARRRGAARARGLDRRRGCSPPRSARPRSPPPRYALTLALRLALGAASGGTAGWSRMFDPDGFEGPNEYLPALTALRYGPGFFLDRFAELVPALPVHAAGHPPGLLLVMDAFGDRHAGAARGAVHRRRRAGRAARVRRSRAGCSTSAARGSPGCSTATAPSVLLFGATSADALYAALGLLGRAGRSRRAAAGARRRRAAARRGVAVRLVAAGRRRVGRAAGVAPRRLQGRARARRCSAAPCCWPSTARFAALTGLRPDRDAARDRAGLPLRDRRRAPVLVLAGRLADRVPA